MHFIKAGRKKTKHRNPGSPVLPRQSEQPGAGSWLVTKVDCRAVTSLDESIPSSSGVFHLMLQAHRITHFNTTLFHSSCICSLHARLFQPVYSANTYSPLKTWHTPPVLWDPRPSFHLLAPCSPLLCFQIHTSILNASRLEEQGLWTPHFFKVSLALAWHKVGQSANICWTKSV